MRELTILGIFGVFFLFLLSCLVASDDHCLKTGGRLIVVSKHEAKGTMNHTECKYDR